MSTPQLLQIQNVLSLTEMGTSREICILDDPVTFPASIRSVIPAKVRVAARHRHGLLHLRPAVELCKVLEYLSKFIIRLYLPFKENANKTRNKYFMLLLCRLGNEKIVFVPSISVSLSLICKDIVYVDRYFFLYL